MKNRSLAMIFLGITVSGCAFKESEIERQQEAIRKMDGRILETALSWDGQDKPILLSSGNMVRAGDIWTRNQVTSLPVLAPETLILFAQVARPPQEVKEWTASSSVTTGDDLNERILGAQILESNPATLGTRLKIRLTGANTLFVRDREQRIYLTLTLRDGSGNDVKKLRFVMSTPPSRLTFLRDEMILGRTPSDIPPELLRLSSQAESRTLIRRITVRNDSFEAIRLTIPFRSPGKFRIRGSKFSAEPSPAPHMTIYSQKKEDQVWDLDSSIYVFPLKEEIAKTWTSFSQPDLDSIVIKPSATFELGLYIPDDVAKQLLSYPQSKPENQTLPSASVAQCNPGATIQLPPLGWCDSSNTGGWNFPPETVELCKQAIQKMRACIDSGRRADLCNQAAVVDEELDRRKIPHPNNGIPWPVYYGCKMGDACPGDPSHVCRLYPGWSWSAVNSTFQIGTQTAPVTVEWKDAQISLLARFAATNDSSNGEARAIPFSNSGVVIRE